MSRPFLILLFFISLEIFVFIAASQFLGIILILLLTIASMIVGVSLCRSRGFRLLNQVRQNYFQETRQAEEIISRVGVLLAGFLMIIPGLITSFMGLLMLIPGLRTLIIKKALDHFSDSLGAKMSKFETPYPGDDNFGPVLDGEYFETNPTASRSHIKRPDSFDMNRD